MFFNWLKQRRRRQILSTPFPPEWRDYLQRNAGRFLPVDTDEQPRMGEIAGYIETSDKGDTTFYILPGVWKSEME